MALPPYAGQPEATRPVQAEVSLLDATSSYLIGILGQSAYGRARPTMEQVRLRSRSAIATPRCLEERGSEEP